MKRKPTRSINTQSDRKAAQLCSQVQQSLEYLVSDFLCDFDASVYVREVVPAPFTTHLLVTVEASDCNNVEVLALMQQALEQQAGTFRSEIAQTIHRKKAPSLSFCVVPS
jgi:ribosome-binding factor A